MNEFMSQRELGTVYGVSSHKIGKWLNGLGLKNDNGKPSSEAFSSGYVTQRSSRGVGTYFWVWNVAKTTAILDAMGYERNSDGLTD